MIEIDKKTYPTKGFYRKPYDKKQIILSGSQRKENYHIVRWKNKNMGTSKEWATYSISRDGKIYEHFNPKYYSDYMGDKEIDKKSISIVLENMGELIYDYESDSYLSAIYMNKCDEERVFEKKWKGFNYWEKYTDEQFNSAIALCEYLCEKFKIPYSTIGYNVFTDKTKLFNGIVTRSNYAVEYNDLNPSFDFDKFMSIIEFGEEENDYF